MKLKFELVKKILLTMEEITGLDDNFNPIPVCFYDITKRITDYEGKEVYYTILKLKENGYIETCWLDKNQENKNRKDLILFSVYDITFKGHEYLNSIRNRNAWDD